MDTKKAPVAPEPVEIKVNCKIWVEVRGAVVFSQGRMGLLEAIDATGSISQAAARMGMSYRAAWGKVTTTEERLGFKLVERFPGHREHGATLTETGRALLRQFQAFNRESQSAVDGLFDKHLRGWVETLAAEGISPVPATAEKKNDEA
ncbi:LysR family transcriptional regulator [Heliobacterium gestii]|uniref:LysR family transcriptional regulator n=1 Tax=Heliomicrobium gestii TaxID=2699 RepID=A0A845L934_HELGE|nr:LysR family transcriptional regulator [Heliomicrobium gestii]MBM7865171.1 molybdate transport system regulatory protein [Heliomicrobium gestii]MZP41440.1 LysR family transcriptional regulator [Heliomicrobium gestii]